MRGSKNFHERGSNENGNFWSQTRGVQPSKNPEITFFLGKFFKFQGGEGGGEIGLFVLAREIVDQPENAYFSKIIFTIHKIHYENTPMQYLRNRSALAVNC